VRDIALNTQTHGLAVRVTRYGFDLRVVENREQIAQQMKIGLLTLLGEWYQDTTKGIPYFQKIMIKGPDKTAIESIFRQRIMEVPGAKAVTKLVLDVEQRTRYLQVTYECDTLYGTVADTIDAPLARGS
jgi:hypothetical protein